MSGIKKEKKNLFFFDKLTEKRYIKAQTAHFEHNKQKRERIMNKKILTAAASLAVTTMSFGAADPCESEFTTWYGDESEYQVSTGCDAGGEKSGYWWDYNDKNDGGASKVQWPEGVELGNASNANALDNVIDYCGGVCGTYVLNAGTLTYDPFVGIGFNIAGTADPEDEEPMVAVDASAKMEGICITYTVDTKATLEMGLGDAGDKSVAYDNPFIELTSTKKTGEPKTVQAKWSDFEQAGWGVKKKEDPGIELQGPAAAKQLVALKFKIQAADGSTGNFNIMSFGEYNGDCKPTTPCGDECGDAAIGAKALKSSLKAQLSGRTLSFGKTVAKAEIVNLHGQVVMSASSVSTMDLAKLQAGVYMVRSMGLSQQIMLK